MGRSGGGEIEGNVMADQLAASIHTSAVNSVMTVLAMDLKPFVRNKLRAYWQRQWVGKHKINCISSSHILVTGRRYLKYVT